MTSDSGELWHPEPARPRGQPGQPGQPQQPGQQPPPAHGRPPQDDQQPQQGPPPQQQGQPQYRPQGPPRQQPQHGQPLQGQGQPQQAPPRPPQGHQQPQQAQRAHGRPPQDLAQPGQGRQPSAGQQQQAPYRGQPSPPSQEPPRTPPNRGSDSGSDSGSDAGSGSGSDAGSGSGSGSSPNDQPPNRGRSRTSVVDRDRDFDRVDRARDWRDDYEDAVSATRWDLSPIPSMPVAPRRADPRGLESLIPPRRGRVQGPSTRAPGGPAGHGPTTREPAVAPWEAGLRDRPVAAPPRAQEAEQVSTGKASRIMALGTMASRLTGLLRQFVLISALGTDAIAGPYAVGNNLPNIIYILVLGGALNAVFVPQLVRAMNRDRDGGAAYASRLVTLTVVVLLVLTAATVLIAPQLVDLFASYGGTNRTVAIAFARLCLPQIFLYGVFVILGQILNAQGKFGPMMWTPVLANVITIAAIGAYWWIIPALRTTSTITPTEVRLIGIGTTLGIVVQTLALIPYVRAAGLRLRPRFDWRGHGLGHAAKLAKWTLAFVLVNQIGLLVVMRYATAIDGIPGGSGWGLAAYNSAFMIWGLPQAIITVSVITALLPRMSRAAADRDLAAVRDDISYGLRVTGVAIVPAAFTFLVFGPHIAVLLFLHGHMTLRNANVIGYMLSAFSLGLIPFSAQFLMLRGFYAFEDTKSPFTINIWISAANVTGSSTVYFALQRTRYDHWSVVAMCAVYGLAYCIGLAITVKKLKAKLHGIDGRRIQRTYTRLMAASAVAAAAAFIVAQWVTHALGDELVGSAAALAAGGGVLGILFLALARVMKVEEVDALVSSVRAKLGH